MNMERIAILTGGDSAEYNISLLSANNVQKNLDKTKYDAEIVHLKNGEYTVANQQINTSDLGVDITPRVQQIKVEEPPKRKSGIKVTSVAELVQKLKNEAKVI